jgi:hypothetical protein
VTWQGRRGAERVGGFERGGDEVVERNALRPAQLNAISRTCHPRYKLLAGVVAIGDGSCAGDGRGPAGSQQRVPVASRVLPHPPVLPSNGWAPEVGRRGPTAIDDREDRPAQDPSPHSRPTCGPPRRLLVLLLQQQLDALSDE